MWVTAMGHGEGKGEGVSAPPPGRDLDRTTGAVNYVGGMTTGTASRHTRIGDPVLS